MLMRWFSNMVTAFFGLVLIMELFDIVSLIGLLNIGVDLRASVLLIVILSFPFF